MLILAGLHFPRFQFPHARFSPSLWISSLQNNHMGFLQNKRPKMLKIWSFNEKLDIVQEHVWPDSNLCRLRASLTSEFHFKSVKSTNIQANRGLALFLRIFFLSDSKHKFCKNLLSNLYRLKASRTVDSILMKCRLNVQSNQNLPSYRRRIALSGRSWSVHMIRTNLRSEKEVKWKEPGGN